MDKDARLDAALTPLFPDDAERQTFMTLLKFSVAIGHLTKRIKMLEERAGLEYVDGEYRDCLPPAFVDAIREALDREDV